MTNTTTETITVTVTSNDERTEFEIKGPANHTMVVAPTIYKQLIDAHLASLPPLDPEWGTRETAGDYVAVFTPYDPKDGLPWLIKDSKGNTSAGTRERWTQIKNEAQK